jgi:hypothetical protein
VAKDDKYRESFRIEERLYHIGLAWLEEKSGDLYIAIEPEDVYENLIQLLGEIMTAAREGKLRPIRMPDGQNPETRQRICTCPSGFRATDAKSHQDSCPISVFGGIR